MFRYFTLRLGNTLERIKQSLNGPPFGMVPCIAEPLNIPACRSDDAISNIIHDMRILLGVPKYRTSKPKKTTRKFSYTRLLSPVTDIVECQSCGSKHQAHTICGTCYSKVRELTNEIKKKMMNYNPYKGDRNDKQIFVKFADDKLDDGVVNGKRVVELEKERPSWFRKIF